MTTTIPPLIAGLMQPEAFPHGVSKVQLRQTHISWILLSGEFAYKIKKPVDLGFVNFTTLERRRRICDEEVRLNRRFAADLYLDVVPIISDEAGFRVSGDEVPVELAVRMRQCDEEDLASRMLSQGRLTATKIDELAVVIAAFHDSAERSAAQEWGRPAQVREPAVENFADLRPLVDESMRLRQLDRIQEWSLGALDSLETTFACRHEKGFVRECHGDLHVASIVNWHRVMTPFDCIEFNPALRWIDVMNEVAFLVMDLDDHGRSDLAWRCLNAYLVRADVPAEDRFVFIASGGGVDGQIEVRVLQTNIELQQYVLEYLGERTNLDFTEPAETGLLPARANPGLEGEVRRVRHQRDEFFIVRDDPLPAIQFLLQEGFIKTPARAIKEVGCLKMLEPHQSRHKGGGDDLPVRLFQRRTGARPVVLRTITA